MQKNHKLLIASLVVAPLILIAVLAVLKAEAGEGADKQAMQRRMASQKARAANPRVLALINSLKTENLETAIVTIITNDDQYYWPGYRSAAAAAQTQIEVMLSSRRCVKLLQSVEEMPESQRAIVSDQLFSKALLIHSNIYDVILTKLDGLTLDDVMKQGGVVTSDPAAHCVYSRQIAMGMGMLINANFGRNDLLLNQFLQLDDMRSRFRARMDATKVPIPLLESCIVPENRFQVNVLRLAAMRSSPAMLEQVDQECRLANMKSKQIPVVAWDAETTWFEQWALNVNMDTNQPATLYTFYDWDGSSKSEQERLVLKLRSVVLNQSVEAKPAQK
jgi:hypothetical protein